MSTSSASTNFQAKYGPTAAILGGSSAVAGTGRKLDVVLVGDGGQLDALAQELFTVHGVQARVVQEA